MNLSDVFDNFIVKQNAIVKQYADLLQNQKNDQQFVLNQMVQNAQGLRTIDSGNLLAKGTNENQNIVVPQNAFFTYYGASVGSIFALIKLDLKGARKMILKGQSSGNSDEIPPSGGVFCFLANEQGLNPNMTDFFLATTVSAASIYDGNNNETFFLMNFDGEVECAGAKFAYFFAFVAGNNFGSMTDLFGSDGYFGYVTYQLLG